MQTTAMSRSADIYDASVIMCVRNGAGTIGRQLEALDRQTESGTFEIVIVDNGSTDGTKEILREWKSSGSHAATSITLIDAGPTPGIPRARNIGARSARGRIIAFCDADDQVGDEWLAHFMAALDRDALAGGALTPVRSDGSAWPGQFKHGLAQTNYLPHVGNCNCAITRSLFFEIGGYDESLPRYGFEDVEISWRVQEAGYPLLYVPGASIRFTVSDNTASVAKRFYLGQGRVLMAARFPKYDSSTYTVIATLSDLLREAGTMAVNVLRTRHVDRRTACQIIAGAGRVAGALKYRGGRVPKRRGVYGV